MKKLILYFIAVNAMTASSAMAYQKEDDADMFKERESEAYIPNGLRAGAFKILPSMSQTNEYNSNIYMRDSNTKVYDSYVAHYKPGVSVHSDWSRHALNFNLLTDITQYATVPDQNNYHDIWANIDGKLDLTRDSYFVNGFAFNNLHENRGSPDQINGVGPTFYSSKVIDNFFNQKFNRVALKTGINSTRYDYDDVQSLSAPGATLRMSTRSHWELKPMIRLGYEIQPQYEAFAKFEYKVANYDTDVLSNGNGIAYNRNSNGYNATTGMAFDLTDLVTGDVSVGYVQRNYDDVRLTEVSGVNGFLNLKYRPTTLTTLFARVGRDINETTQQGVSGVFNTNASLNLEHELLRNVLLKVGGNVGEMEYQGFDSSSTSNPSNQFNRNDAYYGGTAGAKYLLNRNLSTDLSYSYSTRDSNYINSNYILNQVMLNLRGQF